MVVLWAIVGFAAPVVIWLAVTYNGLVRPRNQVKNAWATDGRAVEA